MVQTLICTDCCRDTGVEPDFSHMPVQVVIALTESWLCNDCLDTVEAAEAPAGGPADV
jgi:hypothetical protein